MSINIKFINRSLHNNLPQVFITAHNNISSFNAVTQGVAWRVLKYIGRESISSFTYSQTYSIRAGWDNGNNLTKTLPAKLGAQYMVSQNTTGVILEKIGNAREDDIIELVNDIQIDDGLMAQLLNDNKIIMGHKCIGYQQTGIFKPSNKIFWGLASEIKEGKGLSKSVVLNSNELFELDLTGESDVLVTLNGNAKEGYFFQVE